jgi:hypothetical protein
MYEMSDSALMEFMCRPRTRTAPPAADATDSPADTVGASAPDAGPEAGRDQPCEDEYAALDIAGLRVGSLSRDEIRRLAAHLHQCGTCRMVVAIIVANTTHVESSAPEMKLERSE